MKPRHFVEIFALACICYAMTACATTSATDGTVTKSLDPAAAAMAAEIARAGLAEYQRQHPVVEPAK